MTVETFPARSGPSWWVEGDWNGFFGLFTNVLLNVIVITGLCLGVVKLPDDIVFGRILPALGVARGGASSSVMQGADICNQRHPRSVRKTKGRHARAGNAVENDARNLFVGGDALELALAHVDAGDQIAIRSVTRLALHVEQLLSSSDVRGAVTARLRRQRREQCGGGR